MKVYRDLLPKNVIILVVTVTGCGVGPIYDWKGLWHIYIWIIFTHCSQFQPHFQVDPVPEAYKETIFWMDGQLVFWLILPVQKSSNWRNNITPPSRGDTMGYHGKPGKTTWRKNSLWHCQFWSIKECERPIEHGSWQQNLEHFFSPSAQAHALPQGRGRKWSPRLQLVIFFLSSGFQMCFFFLNWGLTKIPLGVFCRFFPGVLKPDVFPQGMCTIQNSIARSAPWRGIERGNPGFQHRINLHGCGYLQ